MNIEERLANIERSLRLHRLLLALAVAGIAILAILPYTRGLEFAKVRSLEVINEGGRVAASLHSDAFGQGTLKLYGPGGKTLMALETSLDRSGSLRLNHANEREAFWLISSGGQPRLSMNDSAGQERAALPE